MNNVIKEGNPTLREKSLDVTLPLSNEDENLLREMYEYIVASCLEENADKPEYHPSVGIAAVQVGILKKMIAIVACDESGTEHTMLLINPKIKSYSDELTYLTCGEGCLSVDRVCKGFVHRPKRVTIETSLYDYKTRSVEHKVLKLEGYIAVVFQHEFDHLKGILFVDHINKENPFFVPEISSPIKFGDEED